MVEGRRISVHGTVQGVGFRPWVYRLAHDAGLTGRVWNDSEGVTIDAFGSSAALDRFERQLRAVPPAAARIRAIAASPAAVEHLSTFEIVASLPGGGRHVSIPPDLATCPACLAELTDPADRRYRYPFINCTNCGPRFTIATDIPYDRPSTTMAGFTMCAACQGEYDAPADRRFHAQPNACPDCGPRLQAIAPDGRAVACRDAVRLGADAILAGEIVAVKGIGGYHLACDATNAAAVGRLRTRKRRDEKPFAVMVASMDEAARLAVVSEAERDLLTSPARPIVLLTRREPSPLASAVAPGTPLVGLMIAYSPLHHLLLGDCRRPLVMTSGNVSDEPIASDNDDAVVRLGAIADLLLVHDRPIATPADDSVARVIAGAPSILRRSRGYVPEAIPLARTAAMPVLAVGGLLKNACCVIRGDEAFLGPHVGDLDHLPTYRAFEAAVARLLRFLEVTPSVVAYDLHPGYHSTWFARQWPNVRHVGVQHHHAHIASVLAEHGVSAPVVGVAYDGTGYGDDGAAWGGEILRVDGVVMTRIATLRPIPLAGGDAAIRAPWRTALALLDDAFDGGATLEAFPVFSAIKASETAAIRRMIATGLQTVPAHGAGRYFDAVGALLLGRSHATYEGQLAAEVNAVADIEERGEYPFLIDGARAPWEIDLRPAVRALVADLLRGVGAGALSARFHRTLAAATAAAVTRAMAVHGEHPVALSGGCFQNALLTEDLCARLGGTRVLLNRQAPCGDGGLALGQAMVASQIADCRLQIAECRLPSAGSR
ncbi:MAG: carbamoyltransferase HypF [Vicinamibacterales bacterium]|nr:carbamoyltransferase HypF [Vicinamibacterales bacterium]